MPIWPETWTVLLEPARIFAVQGVEQLKILCAFENAAQLVDPGHGIAWRIKDPEAISRKLRSGNPSRYINDLIGIRILAQHLHQIPLIESRVGAWSEQIGLACVKRENVFEHPDPSGYRAIHLDYKFVRPAEWDLTIAASVELQITTWLQHLHNSLAHRLYYKSESAPSAAVMAALQSLSANIATVEQKIEEIL